MSFGAIEQRQLKEPGRLGDLEDMAGTTRHDTRSSI